MFNQTSSQVVLFLFVWVFESSQTNLQINQQMDTFWGKSPSNQTLEEPTKYSWSSWGRCVNCYQRKVIRCISGKCNGAKMYLERPCSKKRCRRKVRQQEKPHIVHLDVNNINMKQGEDETFSKWTPWSSCSVTCRSQRTRQCRKPGLCRTHFQTQRAYCYYTTSHCEDFVFHQLEYNQQNQKETQFYQTSGHGHFSPQVLQKHHNPQSCGISNHRTTKMLKILGGREPERNKWPWHVAIMNKDDEVYCGGTLISPRWVLTASHCIRKFMRVRLNAHNLHERNGPNDITMTIYMMVPHPRFNIKTIENDIALLSLPRPARTAVACLPQRNPRPGQFCSVMGWGKSQNSNYFGEIVLREAQMPIVRHYTCRKSYPKILKRTMLCAGWASGKSDTCAGDSGGALMCPKNRRLSSTFTVQGVTSFGDGCGKANKFGIYTSVYKYLDWIHNIMDIYS